MDKRVKQRCVGAIVLLLIALIIVPVVFRHNSIQSDHLTVIKTIPAAPQKPQVKVVVSAEKKQVVKKKEELTKQQLLAEKKQALSYFTLPKRHWNLQLASYNDTKHAKILQSKLEKKNISASIISVTRKVSGKNEELYRVMLGPYDTKKLAEEAKIKIAKLMGINGLVVLVNDSNKR